MGGKGTRVKPLRSFKVRRVGVQLVDSFVISLFQQSQSGISRFFHISKSVSVSSLKEFVSGEIKIKISY